ncbi:MAG: hypothetical protein NVV60_02025 [Luteimonas sp.]|nr:hypothetical protein [Luteimonas sp.]
MATASVNVTSQNPRNLRIEKKDAWRRSFTDSLVGIPLNAVNAYVCFSIMAAFPKKTPAAEELSERFDMSRATAYRYRAALMAVRGEF